MPRIITFVNTFSYYKLLDSHCHIDAIDTIFIDGILQVKLHNIFHKNKINRASFDFSSLADDFFNYTLNHNLKIAIIGAAAEEITASISNLKIKYPDLQISYFREGYFDSEETKKFVVDTLISQKVDVVILGMGTPAQEEFALFLKNNNVGSHIFTCGGFITQTSRKIDYYNPVAKSANLRWLQRFIEYKHVRKRVLFDYPKNTIRYLFEHIILMFRNTKHNLEVL